MRDRIAYKRRMPHFQQADRQYLVTYVTQRRWTLPNAARDIALQIIVGKHKQLYWLFTATVMPDHVHVVLEPAVDRHGTTYALSTIAGKLKGASSRAINSALGRSGRLWQQESNDHEIRSDESLRQKCEYVAQNPVRAGLVATADDYPWTWRYWVDGEG